MIDWVLMVLSVIVVVLVACLAATKYFASWLVSCIPVLST